MLHVDVIVGKHIDIHQLARPEGCDAFTFSST